MDKLTGMMSVKVCVMIIDENLLLQYGATYESYKKDEFIFCEGQFPYFYFQVVYGIVELKSIRDVYTAPYYRYSIGQCCGEFFLFCTKRYFVSAIASTEVMVLKLRRQSFLKLLGDHPDQSFRLLYHLAESLHS